MDQRPMNSTTRYTRVRVRGSQAERICTEPASTASAIILASRTMMPAKNTLAAGMNDPDAHRNAMPERMVSRSLSNSLLAREESRHGTDHLKAGNAVRNAQVRA